MVRGYNLFSLENDENYAASKRPAQPPVYGGGVNEFPSHRRFVPLPMIRSNYFTDHADLQQHIEELIDWNDIISTYENGFTDAAEYQKTKNPRLEMAPSSNDEALAYYKEILQSAGENAGMHTSQAARR